MLGELGRGHGGCISLCLSRETRQTEILDTRDAGFHTLWLPASHRGGAEPLLPVVLQAECQAQLLPPQFYQYGSEVACADVGRQVQGPGVHQTCVPLTHSTACHWATCRQEQGPKQRRLPLPSAGSRVEMLTRQAFWVVLHFPSADWDGANVTIAGAAREGHGGLTEEPFSRGLFPHRAWLQPLPILLEGRRSASPYRLPQMHSVPCKPEDRLQFPGLPPAQAWLVRGVATRHSPESPGLLSKPYPCL